METLVIYDTTGFIISQMGGDVRTPIGVPFLKVVVPEGKYIASIDVSGTVDTAIFAENPQSVTEVTLATLKADIDALYGAIDFILVNTMV